jgi:hypothetical protein
MWHADANDLETLVLEMGLALRVATQHADDLRQDTQMAEWPGAA